MPGRGCRLGLGPEPACAQGVRCSFRDFYLYGFFSSAFYRTQECTRTIRSSAGRRLDRPAAWCFLLRPLELLLRHDGAVGPHGLPRARASRGRAANEEAPPGLRSQRQPVRHNPHLTPPSLAAQPAALTSGSWRLPRGWGNVGYHRKISAAGPSPEVVTPNIDALVACAPPHPTPPQPARPPHPRQPTPTDPPPRRRRRAGPASSWTASTHTSSVRLRALHSSPAASRSTSTCTTKASAHPAAGSPSA
eukprot:COSAG04_NODE_4080_length_2318_cov_12.963591_4_plen_248_part_00